MTFFTWLVHHFIFGFILTLSIISAMLLGIVGYIPGDVLSSIAASCFIGGVVIMLLSFLASGSDYEMGSGVKPMKKQNIMKIKIQDK